MAKDIAFNTEKSRYELEIDGRIVYADVHEDAANILYIDYIFSPPELRGKGAAGELINALMSEIEKKGFKAKPICGYAKNWLEKYEMKYSGLIA